MKAFPNALAANARGSLKRFGVSVLTGQLVRDIDGHGVALGDRVIPPATVIGGRGYGPRRAPQWLG